MRWWTAQQLKSGKTETREQAIDKLATDGSAEAVRLLTAALDDEEETIRKRAVQALGRSRSEHALAGLLKAIHDRSGDVREAAVLSMRQIGDTQTIESLIPLLEDRTPGVRCQAARTLERFGWQPRNDRDRVLRDVALGDFRSAAQAGLPALDVLIGFLNESACMNRRALVEALGQIGGEKVISPLLNALGDPDSSVKVAAIEALKELRDSRAVQPLIVCIKDKDPSVRATAASALGVFGSSGVTPLTKALADGHWAVRKAAVEAFGRIKEVGQIDSVVKLLRDPDHDVRETACQALGKIRSPRGIPALVVALTDSQTMVRQCAAHALRDIEPDWDKYPEARSVMPQLQEALKDREYWVRQAARETIKRIESAEQLAFEQAGANEKLAAALDILAGLLNHHQRDLRQAAAEALGRMGNSELAHVLAPKLQDEDQWVRASVEAALQQLGQTKAAVGLAA